MKPYAHKLRGTIAFAAMLMLGGPAFAAEEEGKAAPPEAPAEPAEEESGNPDWFPGAFSANVNWATDYVFRGVTQTNEHAAIQGGIDWSYELSPYFKPMFGSWGSNVDFQDGDEAQIEIDLYGGFTGAIGNFSYGVTGLFYYYPGANVAHDYDYWEFGPNIGYDFGFMSLTGQWLASPNYFFESGMSHWLTAGLTVPIPKLPSWLKIVPGANIGQQFIERNNRYGTRDYLTWDVGATVSAFGLDVDLCYYDTDLSRSGCFGGGSTFGDWCEPRFVASVAKVF